MTVRAVDRSSRLTKLREAAKTIGAGRVRVGVLAGGHASDPKRVGEGEPPSKFTLADVAAVHEFGSRDGKVPMRSFIRAPIEAMKPEIAKKAIALARSVAKGKLEPRQALEQLGMWTVGRLRKAMAAGLPVKPLDPKTVDRKGSSKPLIDTGQLRSGITYEVVE